MAMGLSIPDIIIVVWAMSLRLKREIVWAIAIFGIKKHIFDVTFFSPRVSYSRDVSQNRLKILIRYV